jgi:hypothetical protein
VPTLQGTGAGMLAPFCDDIEFMVVLFLAVPLCVLAFLPVFIAYKRRCRNQLLIALAVVISLALLPFSAYMGGISNLRYKGASLLLLWWGPAGLIWVMAFLCSCFNKSNVVQRGFEVLPVGQNLAEADKNVRPT